MFMGYTTKEWIKSIPYGIGFLVFCAFIQIELIEQDRISIHGENGNDMRPLHNAVLERDFDKVEELISLGADVNAKDNIGLDALDMALTNVNTEVEQFLLDNGAQM